MPLAVVSAGNVIVTVGAVVLVVGGLVALVLLIKRLQRAYWRGVERRWGESAARLGLSANGVSVAGVLDGATVSAWTELRGRDKRRSRYTVVSAKPSPAIPLSLERETLLGRGRDAKTGDRDFDKQVRLSGDVALVLALLDAEGRAAVRAAIESDWAFVKGAWRIERWGVVEPIHLTLQRAAALAQRLAPAATSVSAALADRVETDPNPGVRLTAMRLLRERYARSAATEQALPVARALVAELIALGAARTPSESLALADALGFIAHAEALPTLLALLADEDKEVAVAAAQALGAIGGIDDAVPALVPLRDKLLGGALGEAAKRAILAIQARAGSPTAGRLTLAAGGESGLAVVEAEAL